MTVTLETAGRGADIEVLLLKHPDIVDTAVIGIPSEQWGESPLALCVRRDGARVREAEVKEWANGQLSKTQRCPIAFVESGKRWRRDLPWALNQGNRVEKSA